MPFHRRHHRLYATRLADPRSVLGVVVRQVAQCPARLLLHIRISDIQLHCFDDAKAGRQGGEGKGLGNNDLMQGGDARRGFNK